jgi:hypothetical protein
MYIYAAKNKDIVNKGEMRERDDITYMISLVEVLREERKEKTNDNEERQEKPVTINPSMMRCVSAHIVQSLFLSIQSFKYNSRKKKRKEKKSKTKEKEQRQTRETEKKKKWHLTIFHKESTASTKTGDI